MISLSCTNRKSHIEFLLMLSMGGAKEEVAPAEASVDEEHGQRLLGSAESLPEVEDRRSAVASSCMAL